jgi:hypothetical protein
VIRLVVLASSGSGGLIVLLLLWFSVAGYFLPSVVAFQRHHRNQWVIFALNLLFGWTFVGWIGTLVWSLTTLPSHPQVDHVGHDPAEPSASVPPGPE